MRGNESLCEPADGVESLVAPLTARQLTAINLLSMGKSVVATARTIGVAESTLHRWKSTHPLFRATLARRQHDLFDGMVATLRLTMSRAVEELQTLMNSNRSDLRREVMWQMLKLLKPQRFLVPDEPATVEAVLDERIREGRAARGEVADAPIGDADRAAAIPAAYLANATVAEPEEVPADIQPTDDAPAVADRAPAAPDPKSDAISLDRAAAGAHVRRGHVPIAPRSSTLGREDPPDHATHSPNGNEPEKPRKAEVSPPTSEAS